MLDVRLKNQMKHTCSYKFRYKCPLDWHSLKDVGSTKERFCDVCKKSVKIVSGLDEFNRMSILDECVAVFEDDKVGFAVFGYGLVAEYEKESGLQDCDEDEL